MKILILSPAHPYRGGIAASSERLAYQLIEEGHSVELISFKLQYPGFLFPGKSQYTDVSAPVNLKITRMVHSINPFNWVRTGLKLKKEQADLVIVRYWLPFMSPSTGTICRIIKRNNKTKVISIVDNILPHELRPGDKLLTKYFSNSIDGFIAMSNSVFNDLDQFIKNKPKKFSPHPIYDHYGLVLSKKEALESLSLDSNFNYLLFFGFIRDYKGLDILLESLTLLDLDNLKLKLIIAGEFYSNAQKYHDLIKQYNLENYVVLKTDYIPENKVNLYFCASDIITQPYKSATQSGVTQIGYHFNKPMLVTNVGGLPEIIEDQVAGYVVEPNAKSIAYALNNFYEKSRELEMIAGVKKAKVKFEWDKLTKSIFSIFKLCT